MKMNESFLYIAPEQKCFCVALDDIEPSKKLSNEPEKKWMKLFSVWLVYVLKNNFP